MCNIVKNAFSVDKKCNTQNHRCTNLRSNSLHVRPCNINRHFPIKHIHSEPHLHAHVMLLIFATDIEKSEKEREKVLLCRSQGV